MIYKKCIHIIKNILKEIRFKIRDSLHNRISRKKLKNHDFSVISSDCIGGVLCKDLKIRMNSPTRNLFFCAKDFIKFCKNIEYYSKLPLKKDTENTDSIYLTAMCGDIRLFLVHYNSFEQAFEEWEKRKKRINFDNIFFIMTDRNSCNEEYIKEFDKLPYKNKVCFTHIPYPEYKSTFYIPGSEKKQYVETMTKYIRQIGIKRYYDYFDFVSWLNNGKKIS